jgi:CheY-like chemotaxis protein
LLDLGMPVMDGYETVKHMREQPWGKNLLIVALSGWGQTTDVQRSREAGFDSHLVKPASFESLAEVLSRVPETEQARSA